jgi:peptide/nickel transport system permease protein
VRVPAVILTEASLSFLGFGVPANIPSWGGMLSGSARTYMFLAPWMAIWPGLALSFVVWGVNIFGDAMRDLLDPRLKGGIGRYGLKVKTKVTVKGEPGIISKD